ncbi:myo-inositol-1(or 4)-monophosphatase [Conyzicola lurida]|uniref:inositol-phosphate phosphatase n=1 Tax=Conyzicola lurida TaxID=1172621 RepID=A0A841AN02_9MICO|nr:inositol monophosphatase family protein [Conyzicola lurida]MBB5844567.1 myo-inositol-1(or 4)-monophosphatase [Conyzicola lurida]
MAHDELLALARATAVTAGELAHRRRIEGVEIADHKSSPVDVVTMADRETELLIRSLIADVRPDDGFLGEEGGAGRGASGLTWVVDPIDGTVNYLYGIPHWAVSIAVVEGDPDPLTWRALAGCVTNPVTGEIYTATEAGGAFSANQQLKVPDFHSLEQALVGTGFSYDSAERARQGEVVAGLLPLVRDIRRFGAASLDLCAVATGRLNGYFERGLKPWDHAAAALVAREAGAVVTGLDGAPASADFALAAAPGLADPLQRVLRELRV